MPSCSSVKPLVQTGQRLVTINTQVTKGLLDIKERLVSVSITQYLSNDPLNQLPYPYSVSPADKLGDELRFYIKARVDGQSHVVTTLTFNLSEKTYQVDHHRMVNFTALGVILTYTPEPVITKGFSKLQVGVYQIHTPTGYNAARVDFAERELADIETPPWAEIPGLLILTETTKTWIPKQVLRGVAWV